MIKLAVSPGDPAGIGPDICIKAFGANTNLDFIPVMFGDIKLFEERAKNLGYRIKIKEYDGQLELDSGSFWISPYPMDNKVQAGKPDSSYASYLLTILKDAVFKTMDKEFSGLVTGPLNKELMNKGGISFKGHTEILADLSNTQKVLMMLTSNNLKVALASTHVPLSEVPKLITHEHLCDCIKILCKDLKAKWGYRNPCIKVLGLNPHAGDGGYLGTEDQQIVGPAIEQLKREGFNLIGPVSADTAFIRKEGEQVDAY